MGKHQATTLVMTPEELAALPVVQVEGEPDIWLTSGEKQKWGLLWIFECLDHGKRFALVGRSVTRPGSRARWRQGAISLPSKHRRCHHRVWREGEWRLEVPDPLRYIAAPPRCAVAPCFAAPLWRSRRSVRMGVSRHAWISPSLRGCGMPA
jgi:hypothetical protein